MITLKQIQEGINIEWKLDNEDFNFHVSNIRYKPFMFHENYCGMLYIKYYFKITNINIQSKFNNYTREYCTRCEKFLISQFQSEWGISENFISTLNNEFSDRVFSQLSIYDNFKVNENIGFFINQDLEIPLDPYYQFTMGNG